MVRNIILLVHDRCMWPRTHPVCPVTHQNVSRVFEKALKIFATLKTIVHWQTLHNLVYTEYLALITSNLGVGSKQKKTANYPLFVDKRLTPPPLIHVGRG